MPDSTPLNPPPPPPPPPERGTTVRGASSEDRGDSIGPYRLLERLGEGGFGVVWLAERREPFVQRVALKVIKPGMDSRGVIARFDQERQALAVMDHPNVARVLDGGLTSAEQGSRPYFVMEYVKGEPITEYCDRNRLNIRQRLELFIPVCEAVQHAHHKGIIHRDIKPTNVLVTVLEGRLAPKVIDFGVAKAVSHTLTQHTILTEHGQLIGTPEYMSPEQAEMGGTDVDTRTDVYSLGVLLYELLTGQLPFEPATLRAAAFDEVRRIIREEEPPKPSTRLTTLDAPRAADIASRRQQEREELTSTLRRELDWIPLRAMRKDRSRRYASPSALAEDIQRYLDGEVIDAAPESRAYLVRKFVKRHRLPVIAAGAVVGALVLGVVVSVGFWMKARAETKRAQEQAEVAETQRKRAEAVSALVELTPEAVSESSDAKNEAAREELARRLDADELAESPSAEIGLRSMLASTQGSLEHMDEQVKQLHRAIELARKTYGKSHERTLALQSWLAYTLKSGGMHLEACDAFRTLLEGEAGRVPPCPTCVADVKVALAGSLLELQHVDEAELILAPVVAQNPYPEKDWRSFDAVLSLRELILQVDPLRAADYERARQSRVRFLAGALSVSWDTNVSNMLWQVSMSWCSKDLFASAESGFRAFEAAWSGMQPGQVAAGNQEFWIAFARCHIGVCALGQGRFNEAEGMLDAGMAELEGLRRSDVGDVENEITLCNTAIDKYQDFAAIEKRNVDAPLAKWQERLRKLLEVKQAEAVRALNQERASSLNSAAWAIVGSSESAAKAGAVGLERALAQAGEAVELAPEDWMIVNTLGVAQFRVGQFESCIANCARSEGIIANSPLIDGESVQPDASNWVFIALAHRHLGHEAEAQKAYDKAKESLSKRSDTDKLTTKWHAELDAEFLK